MSRRPKSQAEVQLAEEITSVRMDAAEARQELAVARINFQTRKSENRGLIWAALIGGLASIAVALAAGGTSFINAQQQANAQRCTLASEFLRDETPSPLMTNAQSAQQTAKAVAVLQSKDCS